jgi:hypothetical protein
VSEFVDRDLGDDDTLLEVVGETLDLSEPLRADFAERVVVDAFEFRDLDSLLAALVHDSAVSDSGTRGDAFRTVTFAIDDVEIEIEFSVDGTSIIGRIDPADGECVLETSDDRVPIAIDRFGRFSVSTGGSRLRLIVTRQSGRTIVTPWVFY